jgi:RNA polymerase sigma-70 factor (ECF subfamily)
MSNSHETGDGFGDTGPRAADDAQLVALMLRVREGDEGAFRELVEATEDRLFGTVAKMLGGVEGAEDLAQRVYLRIWMARARYERRSKFSTWMFSIMHRLVLNERRSRARRSAVFRAPSADETPREPVSRDFPSDAVAAGELAAAIDAALADLPEEQRTAMVLRRYDEMPYEEIAEVLGTSVSAVRSLLFRARETLKSKLRAWL